MKESVNVWEEDILLPTYGIGRPEKNPMFLEKRVYQGSRLHVPEVTTISNKDGAAYIRIRSSRKLKIPAKRKVIMPYGWRTNTSKS